MQWTRPWQALSDSQTARTMCRHNTEPRTQRNHSMATRKKASPALTPASAPTTASYQHPDAKALIRPEAETWRVRALPERADLEIRFPRVEGFAFEPDAEVKMDWVGVPELTINPSKIPPEVQMKAGLPTNHGRPTLYGPGKR